jgi:hypothetical protein
MKPIDGLAKPTRLVRRKPAAEIARSDSRAGPAAPQSAARSQPRSEAVMQQHLIAKIREMNRLSATRQAIAQTVIDTMLAWKWGEAMHNEPKFAALIRQVHEHIENEPKLQAALTRIIEQLKK